MSQLRTLAYLHQPDLPWQIRLHLQAPKNPTQSKSQPYDLAAGGEFSSFDRMLVCDENKLAATIRVTLYYTSISKCDAR